MKELTDYKIVWIMIARKAVKHYEIADGLISILNGPLLNIRSYYYDIRRN